MVDTIGRKVRIEELAPKPTKVARLTQIAAGAPTLAVAEKMAGASWRGGLWGDAGQADIKSAAIVICASRQGAVMV
jgi:hypothetical protein